MGEANGDTSNVDIGLAESRGVWLTYKRRKYSKTIEDGSAMDAAETRFMGKDPIVPCETGSKCSSSHEGPLNAMKGYVDLASSRSDNESNEGTVTNLCRSTFFDITMSEEFSKLCCLLHDNGMKADNLVDFSLINFKMKESTYETSPLLFRSDLQQVWTKLEKFGRDIVTLAKSMSDKSMASFSKHEDSWNVISAGGKHEFITEEPETQKDAISSLNKLHSCQQCGEKADGRNVLVCDSCEKMYHISCIQPPVKEIPVKSWFCTHCASDEIGSPHDECVVCERIGSPQSSHDEEDEHVHNESSEALEETSKEKVPQYCKVCCSMIINGEEYKLCGHSLCPHKLYHVNCLTRRELKSHARCWYCPSCLCRACMVDQDDHKIVLCDGCDHAYHLYCMQPPRDTIPRGAWFCTRCSVGIRRLRKAKSLYVKRLDESGKRPVDGEPKTGDALIKSGMVDMLLNAAITLKHEEKIQQQGN